VTLPTPILRVTRDKDGNPPDTWCVPPWHAAAEAWDKTWGKTMLRSKTCTFNAECTESPESLRAAAEAKLQELGVWPADTTLPLDVYTLARNVRSEFGDGTPEERAAIIFAGINLANDKNPGGSISDALIHQTKKTYGAQVGSARPASTAQDPMVSDILLANYILSGVASGTVTDITMGATAYLDRLSQDAMHARSVAKSEQNPETAIVKTGEEVYNDWTAGGDYPTWVGHIPNVRPYRLMLLRKMPELRPVAGESQEDRNAKLTIRSQTHDAGLAALRGTNRAATPYDSCAVPTMGAFTVSGPAIAGAMALFGGAIGIAVGLLASTPPRRS
jgi:hypothetical protein